MLMVSIFLVAGIRAYASSPFSVKQAVDVTTEVPGWKDKIVLEINRLQLNIRKEITGFIREFKKGKNITTALTLIILSFLYGLIHALGPGHGKNIVMSYMLSEVNPSVARGVLIGSIVAFGEALSASFIVYGVYYLSLDRIKPVFDSSAGMIQQVSYLILVCVGLGLLLYRVKKHIPRIRSSYKAAVCTNTPVNSKESFLVAISLGIIPCPGVMILLVFMLAMKLPLMGLFLALVMAFGMSVTISVFGVAVAIAKPHVLNSLTKNNRRLELVEAFFEIGGAVLIVTIAILFLLAR